MSSGENSSLIDFDNFDPFAPTQKVEYHQTNFTKSDEVSFSTDPFLDTFDDDNWQDAMNNIGTGKDKSTASFGEPFDAFGSSQNFVSDWNQQNISTATITINSNKNEDNHNHDFFEFENIKQRTQEVYPDEINKELEFVENLVIGKPLLPSGKEISQLDNSIEAHQTTLDPGTNEKNTSISNQNHLVNEEKHYFSKDEEYHGGSEEVVGLEINNGERGSIQNEDASSSYGMDFVNESLIFVSDSGMCKIDHNNGDSISDEQTHDDLVMEANSIINKVYEQVSKINDQILHEPLHDSKPLNTEEATLDRNSSLHKESCEDQPVNKSMNGDSVFAKDSSKLLSKDHVTNRADDGAEDHQKFNEIIEANDNAKIKMSLDEKNEHSMDSDFVEDRPRAKKGLAGLKEYDHKTEEEFSYSLASRNERDSSSSAEKVSSRIFNYGSSLENMCKQCNKRVYEMEKITVDFVIYHKSCFKCATCGRTLSPSTYSATDGQIYCKADFLKNFKMKGSYAFSPNIATSKINADNEDGCDSKTSFEEEETPVVPMKFMKNLFEKNEVQSEERQKSSARESQDENTLDTVISSNVYVIDDELPPPSMAKNLKAMFENKSGYPVCLKPTGAVVITKDSEKIVQSNYENKPRPVCEELLSSSEQGEADGSDIPQAGLTRSLLARWRNIEGTVQTEENPRGREERRGAGSMKRSQSTTRIEISERLKVVSDDRPQMNGNLSKEEGHHYRDSSYKNVQNSTPAPKTFKWQVKEATPLNRPGIVHGDVPKYHPVAGEVISEKTPMSEIDREEYRARSNERESNHGEENPHGEQPARGSYVTEIKEEELPDSAAVRSAMLRFKSLEDPTKEPPVPKRVLLSSSSSSSTQNRQQHSPITTASQREVSIGDEPAEELPASGTTKNLMAMFQTK